MPSSDQYQNEALGGQRFVPNQVWGTTPETGAIEELTLPSGQTCSAQKVTIERLIEMGILADSDALTSTVEKHVRKVKGGNGTADGITIDQAKLLGDSEAMKAVISLADKAAPAIVVDPPVALHYTSRTVGKTTVTKKLTPAEREAMRKERDQPNLIFTDMIPLEDKMELFRWGVGGLNSFLSAGGESPANVGSMGNRTGGRKSTKRNPRNR